MAVFGSTPIVSPAPDGRIHMFTQQLTRVNRPGKRKFLQTIAPNLFLLKQAGIEELLDELKENVVRCLYFTRRSGMI